MFTAGEAGKSKDQGLGQQGVGVVGQISNAMRRELDSVSKAAKWAVEGSKLQKKDWSNE